MSIINKCTNPANSRKVLLLAAAIIIVSLIFTFVSGRGTDSSRTDVASKAAAVKHSKITFATWGSPSDREIQKLVARKFTELYGVDVDVFCFADTDGCMSKVITQFAAGDPFDVFYADGKAMYTLSNKGWLLDLSVLKSDRRLKEEEFYSTAYKKGAYSDNKLYGLPTGINPSVIYYNKKLFTDSGLSTPEEMYRKGNWDLESFLNCCKKIYDAKKVYGMTVKSNWQTLFSTASSYGGKVLGFQKDGNPIVDEKAERALDMFRKGVSDGLLICMSTLPKGVTEDEMFKSEQTAMVYGGYEYASAFKDVRDFEWDVVPFPSDGQGCRVSALSVPMIASAAFTQQKNEVFNFLLFYTGADGQKLRLEKGEKILSTLKYTVYLSSEEIMLPHSSNYYFFSLGEGFTENTSANYLENKNTILSKFDRFCLGMLREKEFFSLQAGDD